MTAAGIGRIPRKPPKFAPRQRIFPPLQRIFAPRHDIFASREHLFERRKDIFAPRQRSFAPRHDIFEPRKHTFKPPKSIFAPRGRYFEPRCRSAGGGSESRAHEKIFLNRSSSIRIGPKLFSTAAKSLTVHRSSTGYSGGTGSASTEVRDQRSAISDHGISLRSVSRSLPSCDLA